EINIPSGFAHGASTQKLDTAMKKVKYLNLLQERNVHPSEAYVLRSVPVIPPSKRTPSLLADGNVRWEDLNGLYSNLAQVNDQLKQLKEKAHLGIGDQEIKEQRKSIYDGLRALIGVGQSAAERDGQ